MGALVDLTNKRFGRLFVVERADNVNNSTAWVCRCDCGKTKVIQGTLLKKGLARSCGCLRKEIARERATRHSLCGTKLYTTYHNMKKRCYNSRCDHYKWYGEEGKHICDEWLGEKGFDEFSKWALANGYSDNLTIDRIDNNKGYSPDNCRWISAKQNNRNRRSNHNITIKGVTKTISEWCEYLNVPEARVRSRIALGWDEERALTTKKLRTGEK